MMLISYQRSEPKNYHDELTIRLAIGNEVLHRIPRIPQCKKNTPAFRRGRPNQKPAIYTTGISCPAESCTAVFGNSSFKIPLSYFAVIDFSLMFSGKRNDREKLE